MQRYKPGMSPFVYLHNYTYNPWVRFKFFQLRHLETNPSQTACRSCYSLSCTKSEPLRRPCATRFAFQLCRRFACLVETLATAAPQRIIDFHISVWPLGSAGWGISPSRRAVAFIIIDTRLQKAFVHAHKKNHAPQLQSVCSL